MRERRDEEEHRMERDVHRHEKGNKQVFSWTWLLKPCFVAGGPPGGYWRKNDGDGYYQQGNQKCEDAVIH